MIWSPQEFEQASKLMQRFSCTSLRSCGSYSLRAPLEPEGKQRVLGTLEEGLPKRNLPEAQVRRWPDASSRDSKPRWRGRGLAEY